MKICIYAASSENIADVYFEKCEEFGSELARRGHAIVFGGGKRGLMGACARGVYGENGEIFGVIPKFFYIDGLLFGYCTEHYITETMRERKAKMEELSDAFVMLPGGLGTFDEFFEILTLRKLDLHEKPIGILNVNGFYDDMIRMLRKYAQEGFIPENVFDVLDIAEDPDELLDKLEKRLSEK